MHRPGGKPLSFLVEVFSGMTRGAVLFGAIAFLRTAGRVTSVGPRDGNEPKKNAPDAFRGVKWEAPLLSAQKLRETALKGCISIVEQKDLISECPM
jgi:hypothetical protein